MQITSNPQVEQALRAQAAAKAETEAAIAAVIEERDQVNAVFADRLKALGYEKKRKAPGDPDAPQKKRGRPAKIQS